MHCSIFLAGAIYTSFVIGLANRQQLSKPCTTTNAIAKEGSTIPEGFNPGVYEVLIDGDGIAQHVQISLPSSEAAAPLFPTLSATSASDILARDSPIYDGRTNHCDDGNTLNRQWADEAVADLVSQFSSYREVKPRHHIYAVRGDVAAFYCNFTYWELLGSNGAYIRRVFADSIGTSCGAYNPGWSDNGKSSIGQHRVGSNKEFCGESHY